MTHKCYYLLLLLTMTICCAYAETNGASNKGSSCRSPLLFVFGASMSDTGEYSAAMPYSSRADFPPYGLDYFSIPVGRWSNGRIFIDFLSQKLGYGFLNAYMQAIDSNFTFGANFASAGSTAQNSYRINSFPTQISQFKRLISRLLSNDSSSPGYSLEQIEDAIFLFEVGNNDYVYQFEESINFDHDELVRNVTNAMEFGFRELYSIGARNFIVMSLTPLGCTPTYTTGSTMEVDQYGCVMFYNKICELHNQRLENLLLNLSQELDGNWILFDAFSLFLDGYQNPSQYGIRFPFDACCGVEGQEHNYNSMITCGLRGHINGSYIEARRCKDPSLYIIWDTIHPVESFAKHMAEGILTGNYLRPSFNISNVCSKSSLHANA